MNIELDTTAGLLPSLIKLALLQHESVDRLALREAAQAGVDASTDNPQEQLSTVAHHLQVREPRWLDAPDPAKIPALLYAPNQEEQWGLLRGKNSQNQWVSEWWDTANNIWREQFDSNLNDYQIAILNLNNPYSVHGSHVYQLILREVFSKHGLIRDVVLGGLLLNVIALAISFYSMQVYDRVIPTGGVQTLLVLTIGVLIAIFFELIAKRTRSHLYESMIDQIDQRLARTVYMRFLAIRLDQLPQSVGGLAAQMRGYETVRSFFTSVTTNLLVDMPFALLFTLVIALIGGWLAVIPLLFLLCSVLLGIIFQKQIEIFANKSVSASNHKTGLLVETVEGAETLKSGQGGWRMLSRWMSNTDRLRRYELKMRNISENSQHAIAAFQQVSYVLMVASGALLVSKGELTMGGLIACSILSGRVLAPVAMIPGQLVQWAHTKAALQGLDKLWALQDDHHGMEQPVVLEKVQGHYHFDTVSAYYGNNKALSLPKLNIRAGEKIGILGPVGAGKTTLLRLLSGMYKPQQGRILLDDIDLAHIAKPVLAEHMSYVQQEGRLFAGTLRENLILGQIDPGDSVILQAARKTGLMQSVITQHPKGLQQEIFEGGTGLSNGQRQLVNLTRAFLRKPNIWLLDEPTAAMDRNLELQVMMALKLSITPQDTLVLVTHKAEMLALVDRIIVIANHQIAFDGPKMEILHKLQQPSTEHVA